MIRLMTMGAVMWVEDWAQSAACRESAPDQLFVAGAEQNRAKQMCFGCPVKTECLAEALDNQIEWGVWGGMTERERRALVRRNPGTSWRGVLNDARTPSTPSTPTAPSTTGRRHQAGSAARS